MDASPRESAAEQVIPAAVALPRDTVKDEIEKLLEEQKQVRTERKRVSAELKNAQRRQKRLKHRARLLSSEDLVSVIALRAQEDARKECKSNEAPARDCA